MNRQRLRNTVVVIREIVGLYEFFADRISARRAKRKAAKAKPC